MTTPPLPVSSMPESESISKRTKDIGVATKAPLDRSSSDTSDNLKRQTSKQLEDTVDQSPYSTMGQDRAGCTARFRA